MMNEEDTRSKPSRHELGCDLSAISAGELEARITQLESEIERIRAEITRKDAGRKAADNLFAPKS